MERLHSLAFSLVTMTTNPKFRELFNSPAEWCAVLAAAHEMAKDGCDILPKSDHVALEAELLEFVRANRKRNEQAHGN